MDAGRLTSHPTKHYTAPRAAAARTLVALAALVCLGAIMGGVGGCSALTPQPRTTVTGPRTTAGHAVTTQAPGVERRWTITIEPATGETPATPATRVADPRHPETPRRKSAPIDGDETPVTDALRAAADLAARTNSRVTVEYRESVPLTTSTATSTLDDAGAGLDARGAGQATGLDQAGRRTSLPWDPSARASDAGFGLSSQILGGSGVNVLHVLGGLCVIAALIPIALPPRRIGLAASIAGTGLLLIAAGTVADEYPWLYAIAVAAFLGVLAYLAHAAWRDARKAAVLAAVVPVVEADGRSEALKQDIAGEAGDAIDVVRAEVRAVKRRLGIA